AALSEVPDEWRRAVVEWSRRNRRLRVDWEGAFAPTRNDEYLLCQTLVGLWPWEPEQTAFTALTDRVNAYLVKAAREAKVNTSWINPNETYEAALTGFARAVLTDQEQLERLHPLFSRTNRAGAFNSLSGLSLRCGSPGVPDVYQGCETWSLRLVDPDNRAIPDYAGLSETLTAVEDARPADLWDAYEDGRVKLAATRTLLHFRRDHPDLFARGAYQPLEPAGEAAGHVVAFRRALGGEELVVAAGRLSLAVAAKGGWAAAELPLAGRYRELFSGLEAEADGTLNLGDWLGRFPSAWFWRLG
ncbi:MAG TPA: malto-oligosyltrehalose synthase, partial [Deinococcales bacterium]|nr:malto-oligosyltrehalose synthase [Deinococcales bacterium]